MPETHVYNGVWRGPLTEWHVYDGTAWRDLTDVWVYDGAWRKVFEASSCACGTTTIDSVGDYLYDPSTCTCQTSPKVIQQGHFCVAWTYTLGTGTLACTKAQIQYNVSGGSYTSVFTLYELNSPHGNFADCSFISGREGYYSPNRCTADNRNYRVRAVLADLTVCHTGGGTGTRSCIF